jgi:hypothetical protein
MERQVEFREEYYYKDDKRDKRNDENHPGAKIAYPFRERSVLGHGDLDRPHHEYIDHLDTHHQSEKDKERDQLERVDPQDDGEEDGYDRHHEMEPHAQRRR